MKGVNVLYLNEMTIRTAIGKYLRGHSVGINGPIVTEVRQMRSGDHKGMYRVGVIDRSDKPTKNIESEGDCE